MFKAGADDGDDCLPEIDGRLVGRQAELNVIGAALAEVASQGRAVHLHGDPGIGKSALLVAAASEGRALGCTVLTSVGSEPESHLPFAALHELLRPLLPDVGAIPDEHRSALNRAFGLSARTRRPEGLDFGSDRFFLGLATVELLAVAARRTPLLLLADDVQWWDAASRETLAFVGRRITTMPAVLLSAARETSTTPSVPADWGTTIRLPKLAPSLALRLLRQQDPGLSAEDERLVLKVADGNPLALIELPVALTRRKDSGLPPLVARGEADVLPLTTRLEQAFAARLTGLPAASRLTLLVAAALDGDGISEIVAAATTLPTIVDLYGALDDAVAADLVTINDDALRFRHPLVRSAVLQLATTGEQREVHLALARAQSGQPDRAAWHRALATVGPDEEVAAALELAAANAWSRGAPSVAAGLFERAAALSVADRRRGHRLLRAAELEFELGRGTVAGRLLTSAGPLALDPEDRARLVGLSAVFNGTPGSPDDIRLIVSAAETVLAGGDRALGAYLLIGAARRCLWSSAPADVRELVRQAAAEHLPESDPRLIQITAFVDPLGRGAEVVSQLKAWAERAAPDPATGTLLGIASFLVADFDRTLTFVTRSRDALRQQGRHELLAQGLAVQAMAAVYTGRFAEAGDAALGAHDLARETGQPVWTALATFAQAHLEAVHGRGDSAATLTGTAEQTAIQTGNRALLNRLQLARGLNALGAGQPAEAFAELRRLLDPSDPVYQASQAVCGVDYLAESAVSAVDREEARTLLEQVETLTQDTPATGVRRSVTLARALLAPHEAAEGHFREAAVWAVRATPWYRARVDLGYGAWLGRNHRPTEARRALRSAWAVFRALDAPAWAERAQRELAAVEQSVGQPEFARGTLSAQELQVARLAARGLSNREIAAELHLSVRTVASHLYRVFPKLGVRSRAQLHLALADQTEP